MNDFFSRARTFNQAPAVRDDLGVYSYHQLLQSSAALAAALSNHPRFQFGDPVAMIASPGFEYVCFQWAIWRAGGIAVPLCPDHPLPAIKYVLQDSACHTILATDEHTSKLEPLCQQLDIDFIIVRETSNFTERSLGDDHPALILYTSGTTSDPKGVVLSHGNIKSQVRSLTEAWQWQPQDVVLNVLPLHHVHGIINILCCALWSGALCEFQARFDPQHVMERFLSGHISVFMAVPTIYHKLIEYWKRQDPHQRRRITRVLESFRLMVSGSAALPVPLWNAWKKVSGQILLERYGMTEIGMALSNPYQGERRAGFVGNPLPGVQVKLVDERGRPVPPGEPGEIWVKGPAVFKHYWNRPEITAKSFHKGWFKTGDMAVKQLGAYKILGRQSMDIIKTGGYKVSALEIESKLLEYPSVLECAVVGMADEVWGEKLVAVSVTGIPVPDPAELMDFLSGSLPTYKIPRTFIFVDSLPRNHLGKVMKPVIRQQIKAQEF